MELIDKAELMKYPIRIDHYDKEHGNEHFVLGIESVLEFAEQLPTIDAVEVVHAGWQSHGDFFTSYLKCPVCEKSICAYADNGDGQRFDYCPNCGAKMDGHKKEGL